MSNEVLVGLTSGSQREKELYREDISSLKDEIQKLQKKDVSEVEFQRFRLKRGTYGQKQKPNIQMIRVKIPWGRLTQEQLLAFADVADQYAEEDRKGIAHVTTRQAVQFHFVPLEVVPDLMEKLRHVGLTTREACANTVRNVSADPLAGVAHDEVFDVSPYAETVTRYFLRHKVCQELPRKFKITFSGSHADRGLVAMHDVGCIAESREKDDGSIEYGWSIWFGGGLGSSPRLASKLEDFTPLDQLLPTLHAILFFYDRDWDYGRKNRNMARIKCLVNSIGVEESCRRIFEMREKFLKTESYPQFDIFKEVAPEIPEYDVSTLPETRTGRYLSWRATNVQQQKQDGYCVVTIRLKLGDIQSHQLRKLADICVKYGNKSVRTTPQQNIILRWIPERLLFAVYRDLMDCGLHLSFSDCISDVTSCPGADTCQLGITSSRGLARAIGELFETDRAQDAGLRDIRIKISGCPNSCGHHHTADIGFFGGASKFNKKQTPSYTMLLGGHIEAENSQYAKSFMKVYAKQVPSVVGYLVDLYKSEKQDIELFRQYISRVGSSYLKNKLGHYISEQSVSDDIYTDWGQDTGFVLSVGKGECAV